MFIKRVIPVAAIVYLGFSIGYGGTAPGQILTSLHSFNPDVEGYSPEAGLIQGTNGNFYGATFYGQIDGNGTVFMVSPNGAFTTLGSFPATDSFNEPSAALILGFDGNFYSTTTEGGTNFVGSIFRLTPAGAVTQVYQFGGDGTYNDGDTPVGPLIQGQNGNLYGTTVFGGASYGDGNVFMVTSNGALSSLYAFTGGSDGAFPYAGLIQFNNGTLCGTAYYGGTTNAYCNKDCTGCGCGVVFTINLNNNHEAVLHAFNGADGESPNAAVVLGTNGSLYGTTSMGGTNDLGTVFRVSPSGVFTSLWSFTGRSDGAYPYGPLVQGSDGNFYGITSEGGNTINCPSGCGVLFRIGPSGGLTPLWQFSGGADGSIAGDASYAAGLVQGIDGSFYGVTSSGGAYTNGVAFKLTVPLSPPLFNHISNFQVTGSNAVITIPSVAGEFYQLQVASSPTGGWVNAVGASITNAAGSTLIVTNVGSASPPQKFYRFAITP